MQTVCAQIALFNHLLLTPLLFKRALIYYTYVRIHGFFVVAQVLADCVTFTGSWDG